MREKTVKAERGRQYKGRERRRGEDTEQKGRATREERKGGWAVRPRLRVGGAAGLSAINSSTL